MWVSRAHNLYTIKSTTVEKVEGVVEKLMLVQWFEFLQLPKKAKSDPFLLIFQILNMSSTVNLVKLATGKGDC